MTARERIAQEIAVVEAAISDSWQSAAWIVSPGGPYSSQEAHERAKLLLKYGGRILAALAQRRALNRALEILEHEAEQFRGRNDK